MPALAFSLAMLARLGPLLTDEDFWMPALALAVDQSEPKASPEDLAGAGLLAAPAPEEVVVVAEVKDEVEGMLGRWPETPPAGP